MSLVAFYRLYLYWGLKRISFYWILSNAFSFIRSITPKITESFQSIQIFYINLLNPICVILLHYFHHSSYLYTPLISVTCETKSHVKTPPTGKHHELLIHLNIFRWKKLFLSLKLQSGFAIPLTTFSLEWKCSIYFLWELYVLREIVWNLQVRHDKHSIKFKCPEYYQQVFVPNICTVFGKYQKYNLICIRKSFHKYTTGDNLDVDTTSSHKYKNWRY